MAKIEVKSILLDIIIYTLENQQVLWNGTYYMLDKGMPTGGKHCVPLANILLSYILKKLLKTDNTFRIQFKDRMKLWKRYIDDAGGVFLGMNQGVRASESHLAQEPRNIAEQC